MNNLLYTLKTEPIGDIAHFAPPFECDAAGHPGVTLGGSLTKSPVDFGPRYS